MIPWLRPKVTYWLNRLASNDLPSILYIFVHAAHYLPGATVPTAALHLARALIRRVKHKLRLGKGTSSSSNSAMGFMSIMPKPVWKQLVYTLTNYDNDESNANRENNIEMAGRLVTVSLLPLLSSPGPYIRDILCLPMELPVHPQQNQTRQLELWSAQEYPQQIGIQRLKLLLEVLPPPPFRNHFCQLLLKHEVLDILIKYAVKIWPGVANFIEKKEVLDVVENILNFFIEGYSCNKDTDNNETFAVKQAVVYLVRMNVQYSFEAISILWIHIKHNYKNCIFLLI